MGFQNPNINHGNDTEIHVKADKQTRRTYLKFDLNAVPVGTTITSAKLYLYCTAASPSTSLQVDVHETNDSWSEDTIAWNNAPAVGALAASNTQVNGIGKYYYWDVTSYAQLQFGGDKILSVVVKFPQDDPSSDNPNWHRDFASKEYNGTSCDPYLEITYTAQAPVASFTYSPAYPSIDETVTFNASASYDPDGNITSYRWDFGDGNITTVNNPIITHIYTVNSSSPTIYNFTVTLTVTDNEGLTNSTTDTVAVMNPAILHVSLPAGTYVGPNPDDWLSQCWLLNITSLSGTFTIRINNTHASWASYDTHLIIALNNASYEYLENVTVAGTTILKKTNFTYGIPEPYGFTLTWEEDVYPTWFSDVYVVGTVDPKSYKDMQVSVTFSNTTGVRMHFDAYGSRDSPPPPTGKGRVTHNPHQKDSTVLFLPPVNTPPSISGLPDLELNEDTSLDNATDLWNYASDAETPVEALIFTILSVTNPDVGVTIDSNRYIDVQPTANWYGTSEVTIQVYDGELTDTDSFNITVNPVNDPPVVSDIPNQTISEDGTFATISLDDYVYDVDNADSEISWTYSGNVNLTVSISADRVATITAPADWYGVETINFTATDPSLLSDSDNATFTVNPVNDPPVVSDIPDVTFPEDGSDSSIDLDDYVSDVDNTDAEMTWTFTGNASIIVSIDANNVVTFTAPANWFGQETITFRATDPGGLWDEDATTVTVTSVNDPPVASGLAISPSSPVTEDNLVGSYTYYDADSDPESGSEIRWYKDGLLQSAFNDNLTVPSSATANGQAWYFTVRPKDGKDFGALQTSPSVTIQNSPPSIGGVNITPDPAYTDDTLTATPYGWYDADVDSEGYIYQWQKWDGASWQDISGETSNTLSFDNFVKEDQIKVICTPFDGEDYGTSKEDTITISNSPPSSAPVVDITPDFPLTTDDLVCTIITPSIDPDGDTVTYTYEWYKNDVLQPNLTTVTTDLSVTLDSSNTHKGEVWKCVVTPYGSEPGPPGWDQLTIQNSPPVLDPIGNKTVNEETELSFTATASDPDMDPLTFSLGPGAPHGAVITSDGYFTWTPTEAQGPAVYNINITVSDSTDIDYEVIEVTVNEVNQPPVLNPIGPKTVSEGALLQFTVTASDPDIPTQTLIYSASNFPLGATFNSTTRVFSWTPTSGQAGVYPNVHFEVTDGYLTDSEDITITVTTFKPPVGGYAAPIDKSHLLAPTMGLAPWIGLAFTLLAAMAVTVILIRRRNKTF